MHLSAHVIAGAAIGQKIRWPWLALLIGVLSHGVLDAAPQPKLEAWIGPADVLIIGLGVFLSARLPSRQRIGAFLCISGAALPDIEGLLAMLLPTVYTKRLYPTHNGLIPQWEPSVPWGHIVQIGVIVAGLLVLWRAAKLPSKEWTPR